MECTVRWVGANAGMSFIGESGSGHVVVMDGAPEAGGRNLGPRPMEMLLMGTGGCSAFDVVLILQRARQKVSDCQVQLRATVPKLTESIYRHPFFISSSSADKICLQQQSNALLSCRTTNIVRRASCWDKWRKSLHSVEIIDTAQQTA